VPTHNVGMTGTHGDLAERLARAGVTEREAEVLSAVAERLRNREIAERLYLSVRTVESHVAALMRKLGVADRTALAALGADLRRASRADAALPAPLTSLVGREDEIGELSSLAGEHRLVTLVGPAGVGKTRLALSVASNHTEAFPDGVRLADLAPVRVDLVGDTIARALGVVPQPGWSVRDVLRETAGGMRSLLLVDNCEHVVAEAAEIIADLLSIGDGLKVLATSREPLGVPGEVSYQVRTLPVPDPGDAADAEAVGGYDAVRLFAERAATASPGFRLTEANAPAVAALCRRLDGLPLAIELAASRVRSFEPAQLVEHLDHRFELLSGGARTALPRQRTLRGAIDWSYDLLDEDERALFDRLGVFPADFDYGAARAICGADGRADGADGGADAVIALLPRLVDKSLVSTLGRGTRRYRLLETLRAYAAQRLAVSGTGPASERRHATHYLAVAEQAAGMLRTAEQRSWLGRLNTEQPNLRAALAFSVTARDVEDAWRWIAALQRFWEITGQRREAEEWIKRTLALGDPPPTSAVVAGVAAASLVLQPSDSRVAFDLARRATRLAADLDDVTRARAARALGMGAIWVQPELVLPALQEALAGFGDDEPWERAVTLQCLAQAVGDLGEGLRRGRESASLFRQVGDHMFAANTLFIMAQRAMYAGVADDEVHGWLTESRALAEAAGSEEDQVHASVGFGQLAQLRGDLDHAAQLMAECLPRLRRRGDQRCAGRALYVLGERAREQRQLDRAEELLGASVRAITLAGQSFVLVNALEALAAVISDQDRQRTAAVLLGVADSAREVASAHMRPLRAPDEALRRSLVAVLGAADFDTAHGEGERLSPTQALDLVSDGERGRSG
jgi:predicted ATPase/DNA-binding CsgD family transcriptional regulator